MITLTLPTRLCQYLTESGTVLWIKKTIGKTVTVQIEMDELNEICHVTLPELMDMWLTNSTEESLQLFNQADTFLDQLGISIYS